MHFRVVSATKRKRRRATPQLHGASLPKELQLEYQQWLQKTDRAVLPLEDISTNKEKERLKKWRRKPRKLTPPKPQRATFISGSLKPTISRLREREMTESAGHRHSQSVPVLPSLAADRPPKMFDRSPKPSDRSPKTSDRSPKTSSPHASKKWVKTKKGRSSVELPALSPRVLLDEYERLSQTNPRRPKWECHDS